MTNTMRIQIELALQARHMTKRQLALALNWSPNALYNKLRRNNFTERDLRQIATALNCTFEAQFVQNH